MDKNIVMPVYVRPKRYELKTFSFAKIFGKHIDEWTSAEQYERSIRLSLARELAEQLLDAGAIEITVTEDRAAFGPLRVMYKAQVRAAVPKED